MAASNTLPPTTSSTTSQSLPSGGLGNLGLDVLVQVLDGEVDPGIRAVLHGKPAFGLGRDAGQHAGAAGLGHLDHGEADAARGAGDEDGLAGLDLSP